MASFTPPLIMAVVNATPDSYFQGSRLLQDGVSAEKYIQECIRQGPHIIDIGGESSRPGATSVSVQEELDRVCKCIDYATALTTLPISIDTVKPKVAEEAIQRGATIINDISGFIDPQMVDCLCRHPKVRAIVMHMQGQPNTMQTNPLYPRGVVVEVREFFYERLEYLEKEGVTRDRVILDPGIGFGKTIAHNLELMRAVPVFKKIGLPLLYGVSRKAWLQIVTGRTAEDRLAGTLAAASYLISQGVDILRVHDVAAHIDVIKTLQALL